MVPENVSPEQIAAGQAVYTKRMLGIYDWLVLGLSNRLIWRCPTQGLVAQQACHGESFGCRGWNRLFPRLLPVSINGAACRVDGPQFERA
jgi:hypothetical protein